MKTCPKCNQVYTDETYAFCLEDGTLLSSSYDPKATIYDSDATFYDPQATVKLPISSDYRPPTEVTVPFVLPPTQSSQSFIIQRLLNHLKDESQKFKTLGKFRFNNEYIWTNGHFFEIAESIPSVLIDVFPLKENSAPAELVKSLQNQLTTTYTKAHGIVPSKKEGMIDLFSDKSTVHVNNIYYQYLEMRYLKSAVMLGTSPANPALFVSDNKLRAGIMGVKL